ncbi:MAG: 2Fe-2S iron-sulfur cluster-binding protein [Nitrospiria bacterium]
METTTQKEMEQEKKSEKTYKVLFLPMNIEGAVKEGESILDAAENCGVDLPHNCGGVCACSTCHVIIKQGMDKLTPKHEEEEDRLDMAENLTLDSRLGCQARVYGDVIVELPECTRKE